MLNLTDADDRNQALDFLAQARAINVASTPDRGRFALPSSRGVQMLATRELATEKKKEKKVDRRLQVVLALFAAAVAIAIARVFRH